MAAAEQSGIDPERCPLVYLAIVAIETQALGETRDRDEEQEKRDDKTAHKTGYFA